MLLRYWTQHASEIGKFRNGHRTGKVSFQSNPNERNTKEFSNYCTPVLISHASKVMLKILQAKLQQCVNWDFLMCKLDLEKAEGPEIKLPTFVGS